MKINGGKMKILLACSLLLSAYSAWAADNEVGISFRGTLNEPLACTLNNDRQISVDFGDDMMTTKVNGLNYTRAIDYTLECRNNSKNTMRLKIMGVVAGFNNTAIQSSNVDLAIALRANGVAYTIGSWLNFTYPNKPVLQAVPIKEGNSLSAGFFSAGATMMVDYQ
ncbi:TPA: fimbrial protein [Serratia marcescens]